MEIGSIIMGLITLAFFIVPVIYLQKVKEKERKVFLKDFLVLAGQQQIAVAQYDFWNHCYAIGMDPVKNQLFYLKKREGKEQKVLIDLKEVEKCSFINLSRVVNENKIIDRLGLSFTFRNSKIPEKALEFYNNEESMSLDDEFQLLEKWKTLVDSHLQATPTRKSNPETRMDQEVLV